MSSRRFVPGDPAYSRNAARMRSVQRYYALEATHGAAHPATRAAYGRLLYHLGYTPQRNATSIEARAWLRESGNIPGFLNRRERRQIARPS